MITMLCRHLVVHIASTRDSTAPDHNEKSIKRTCVCVCVPLSTLEPRIARDFTCAVTVIVSRGMHSFGRWYFGAVKCRKETNIAQREPAHGAPFAPDTTDQQHKRQ